MINYQFYAVKLSDLKLKKKRSTAAAEFRLQPVSEAKRRNWYIPIHPYVNRYFMHYYSFFVNCNLSLYCNFGNISVGLVVKVFCFFVKHLTENLFLLHNYVQCQFVCCADFAFYSACGFNV